jgi:parallel beta-helix repeat protein
MIHCTSSYGTIQKAIDAAVSAGGGIVHVLPGIYREHLVLGSKVSLVGEPGLTILKAIDGSNADVISGTNLTGVRITGIEIDGNGAAQTGSDLSGDDPAITGRGIFLSGCVGAEIINCHVHDCRLHGILIYGGSDNRLENVRSNANGSLEHTRYGNGLMIWDSPRCRVRDFSGNDNAANSGLSTRGALGVGIDLSGINCERNMASNITINSPHCRLSNFYSTGALGASGCGVNIGHNSDPDLYADYCVISSGISRGNAITGLAVGACAGGVFSNLVLERNTKHNLLISATNALSARRVHHLAFDNCLMDTTTETGDLPTGDNILITSLGSNDPTIGDMYFTNCQSINALRDGLRIMGASRIKWTGGTLQSYVTGDNGQPCTDIVIG